MRRPRVEKCGMHVIVSKRSAISFQRCCAAVAASPGTDTHSYRHRFIVRVLSKGYRHRFIVRVLSKGRAGFLLLLSSARTIL